MFVCSDSSSSSHQGYELVRKGLKLNLGSHICWHVYGLMYRADRDYREATKCYRNALRIDRDNLQILRDLSLLQIQLRDYDAFVETRRQLLTLKSSQKNNWISFAVANHLSGALDTALSVISSYEDTTKHEEIQPHERYEHSEMLLYKAMLMMEAGDYVDGIACVRENLHAIRDKVGAKEMMGEMLLKTGQHEEAAQLYRKLINVNPENYEYHKGLCAARGGGRGAHNGADGSPATPPLAIDELKAVYKELQEAFPKGLAVRRIPLDFLTGDDFEHAFAAYIKPYISKGVPSLFSDVRALYTNAEKKDIMCRVVQRTCESLRDASHFPDDPKEETTEDAQTALVWTLLLRARQFDELEMYDEALTTIEEAIGLSPTTIDLYTTKSALLKHAGDITASAAAADEARCMDLSDRYLNSFCVKRMLANNDIERAEKTAVLFSRDGDQMNNLYDIQCMWYEVAAGAAYARLNDLGRSLKKFLAVGKHFADITEDQFDFHQYCIRKMTLRTYIRMLRVEDELYGHKYYFSGAKGAICAYLRLADRPSQSTTSSGAEGIDMSKLTPAEKKKLRNRLRKEAKEKKEAEAAAEAAEKQAQKEAAKAAAEAAKEGGKPTRRAGQPREVDQDPHGAKLLECEDPVAEAAKIVRILEKHAAKNFETHILAFEVHLRRKKFLLALRAMLRALRMDATHSETHKAVMAFFHAVSLLPKVGEENAPSDTVCRVIEGQRQRVLGSQSLAAYNEAWIASEPGRTTRGRGAAATAHLLLHPDDKEKAIAILLGPNWAKGELTLVPVPSRSGLEDSVYIHELLQSALKSEEAATAWAKVCATAYMHSSYFKGERHLERLSFIVASKSEQKDAAGALQTLSLA